MLVGAPGRPVVGGEGDVGVGAEQLDRLVEVARPDPRVADQRAAQGQQVVQVVGGVLGHAQGAVVREEEVHLGRRLGARRHLEDDPDAVDDLLLAGVGDVDASAAIRPSVPSEVRDAQAGADLPARARGPATSPYM